MILNQEGTVIGSVQRQKNFFVFDIKNESDRLMIAKGKGRPTYLLSKDPQVRLWHRRFGHASNVRIVQASKLVDGIKLSTEDPLPLNKQEFRLRYRKFQTSTPSTKLQMRWNTCATSSILGSEFLLRM